MRAVVQRVSEATVRVGAETVGAAGRGLLVLVGVGQGDSDGDADYLADKVLNLRVFPDEAGQMNLSVLDVRGDILAVSQFTLYGDVRKGRRPSFDAAAPPEEAEALYERVVELLRGSGLRVSTGRFRAMMDVRSRVDGPVTILVDSRKQF